MNYTEKQVEGILKEVWDNRVKGGGWSTMENFVNHFKQLNNLPIPLVVNSKITITTDESCEMLKIEKQGNCFFYGNETDFNRDAITFKNLFEKLGNKCEIVKKDYNKW